MNNEAHVVLKVNVDAPPPPEHLKRSPSWVWDWKTSPAPSRGSSLHGANAFGSREGSTHGGNSSSSRENSAHGDTTPKMRRNVSFSSEIGLTPSRESSQHGGSVFGLRRNGSWLWDWQGASSAPASRDASLHGQSNFTPQSPVAEEPDVTDGPEAPTGQGNGLVRSMSFLWDWSKYRQSPASTPGNSLHGGNAFAAPPKPDDATPPEPEESLPFKPPKAMQKELSIGSFLFDWGQSRVSPPGTPGASLHGGSNFPNAPAAA